MKFGDRAAREIGGGKVVDGGVQQSVGGRIGLSRVDAASSPRGPISIRSATVDRRVRRDA